MQSVLFTVRRFLLRIHLARIESVHKQTNIIIPAHAKHRVCGLFESAERTAFAYTVSYVQSNAAALVFSLFFFFFCRPRNFH